MKNFYPDQYKKDKNFFTNHNYLSEQFSDNEIILKKIKEVVQNNDFTLGAIVDEVEEMIANEAGTKYAIGVGSGTDALFLSLKALGIGNGDEVITTTYTFYATIGAIVTSGAKPVFCDCSNDYNIDPTKIESLITEKTRAIMPVHWSGRPCDMDLINKIAEKYGLAVIEDACHAIQASYKGNKCGSLGTAGCFSFHPLKNLNVWGDGGIVTTNNKELADKLKLIRNHGLVSRDSCEEFAYNSRLDSIQAVVVKHVLENKLSNITNMRRRNSMLFDQYLSNIEEVTITERSNDLFEVFHLYMFQAKDRLSLYEWLRNKNIDAKVHYPIPMHLQPAANYLNYKKGDFPVAEKLAETSISLPVHEFITEEQVSLMSRTIEDFYKK